MANENGWGDGASNNNIGWGQGAVNNSISWGYLHQTSYAGLTDIYGQSYQPEAAAFFTAVEDAGGTLTDNVKAEFDAFVVREKDAGRWSKLKRLYPYLGGTIDSAVIDAVTTNAATNNNFVDADADATIGLQGDGSTKRLDTALAANIWANTNDWQIYLYEIEAETSDRNVFGAISGGNDTVSMRRRNVSSGVSYIYGNNISIAAQVAGSFDSQQSVYGGRFSNTDLTIYEDSATATSSTLNTFAFPVTYAISLFARNGASIQYSNAKVGCHMMAEGMSKADMTGFDTSYKTFINNITAYAALMDSYSGAAVAYSLRKVYSTYEGSAINVRRSSDNATQDIGFDGYVLDEAALLSFVGAGNGFVTTWYDQSGNGNNATQTLAAEQSLLVSSGSVLLKNGKPAVYGGSGTQRYLVQNTLTNGSPTSFGVISHEGVLNAAGYCHLTYSNISTNNRAQVISQNGSASSPYLTAPTSSFLNGSSFTFTTRDVAYDNTGNQCLVTLNYTAAAFIGLEYIGASFTGFSMHTTQEVIVYDSNQLSNRAAIEALINTYYNIY